MSVPAKDTIYIDSEDEITSIISKMRSSDSKIIALVLPKRAPALQSIVNLKLLKRTAKESKKNIVLITSDKNLLPIAGAVGLLVAKTPQSKPEIPTAHEIQPNDNKSNVTDSEDIIDPNTPIGELSNDETIEIDNDKKSTKSKTSNSKNNKFKIPNFNKFRLFLFGGIGLIILLIVGSVFAFVILPKAVVSIKTDTASISTELKLTAKTGISQVDEDKSLVPAIKKEIKKTDSEKIVTTGQKNVGDKAKGSMSLKNCTNSDNQIVIPAGTNLVASNLSFTTDEAITLPQSVFSGGGSCLTASKEVDVTAVGSGDNYNLGSRDYVVSGYSSVRATGSDMKGGSTKLVQSVSQADIDNAKQRLLEKLNIQATDELKKQFVTDNMLPLDETYSGDTPVVTSVPSVNNESAEAVITVSINYSELGIKKDDVKKLIENNVNKQIDSAKQSILDDGLDEAVIRLLDKKSADEAIISISTISIAGPQLDSEGIKKDIAGTKKGASIKAIESRPGIKEVEIDYSPFWVYSTPKNIKKITINFNQSTE